MFKPVYDSEQHVQEPLGTEEWLAYQKQLTNQHYQDLHDAQQNTYIEDIIAEQDLYIKEYQAEMDKQIRLYELEREIRERQVPKPSTKDHSAAWPSTQHLRKNSKIC